MDNNDFEAAYYINLPHRVDRKISFEKAAKFLPIKKIIRFEAIDGSGMDETWPGTPGAWGCRESHIKLLEMAQKEGLKKFIVFEDDVTIKNSFTKKFNQFLSLIDDDWDMIYLYAKNHYLKPIKLNKNVMQLQNTLGNVAIAYNSRNIDIILNKLKNDYRWVDSCMADLHLTLKVYAPTKSLVGHLTGFSDNLNAFDKTDRSAVEELFIKSKGKFKAGVKFSLRKIYLLK